MEDRKHTAIEENMPEAVYVHIPFCRAKCAYCDFDSYAGKAHLHGDYTQAVCVEGERYWRAGGRSISTVYVGGGTPTMLDAESLGRILVACAPVGLRAGDAEVTVEANPGTVDGESLRALRRLGINRLSLGVQSLDDDMLKRLGRVHSAEEACAALALARDAGFDNVNLDFIYGLPGQTLADWRRTLDGALRLRPEHLSLYALSVEEGTPLAGWVERGEVELPGEDEVADMYRLAEDFLAEASYEHYEISNWSRPGMASRHNGVYWANHPYVGLGAGAHSYLDGQRRHNVADPAEYVARLAGGESPVEAAEPISPALEMAETVFLGLRRSKGVDAGEFEARFGRGLREVYRPAVEELGELGLLEESEGAIRLTRRGRLLGNEVFVRFLPQAE